MENTRYKFRAWYEKGGYMMPVEEIDFNQGLINKSGIWRWFHEVELMQSAGLKDKNGVQIFEGDIASMVVFEDNAEYLGDVVFKNGCFCLNISLDGTEYKITALEWKETETIITVIGNIYENADLLEVEE